MRRNAFTMIELTFSLAIMGLIALYMFHWSGKVADDTMVKQEYLNAYRFENGLKTSFIAILDTFESTCGNIPSDGTTGWGWSNSGCVNTSPLPVKSGNNLVYNINLGTLSSAMQTSLINQISSSFAPMCTVASSTATSLTLYCGTTFTNLQYNTASGLVNQYHTPGTNFNMLDTPVPVLTLTRNYNQGNFSQTKTYSFNMSDVMQQRMAKSTSKMENIAKMLKNLYNLRLAQETTNTAPAGLNSVDDELIPWFWEAFGDNFATASTTNCAQNSVTGVCDNLNTSNIWRSTTGNAVLWRRLIAGAAGGDYRYTVDGFGNQLTLYPIESQCAGTNLSLCGVSAPAVPQGPYPISTTLKPPYVSIIYSTVSSGGSNCADTSTQAPMACRYPIVY